ncbi:MAG: hypothetical protein IH946_03515 [Bacteroidetes bacterium]|nr:hypothetical protein [Bacteroidota bacterium]
MSEEKIISSDELNSMMAEIILGRSKENSKFIDYDKFSETWDVLAKEIKEIRDEGYIPDIPSEWP